MKKLNHSNRWSKLFGLSVIFCTVAFLFSSCMTMPKGRKVEALSLLDNQSNLYFAVPNNVDNELIEKIISDNVSGLAKHEIERIIARINTAYIGVNTTKKVFSSDAVQVAIDGNFPKKMIPKFLNKKNGWNVIMCSSCEAKKHPIYTKAVIPGSEDYISMSFPANNVACMGRNIEQMLGRYDTLSLPDFADQVIGAEDSIMHTDEYFYNYLLEAKDEIRFFANNPKSFLSTITGVNLDLKIVTVAGAIVKDDEDPEKYKVKFIFKFSNNKYLKAGRALLKLALGMSNSEVEDGEDSELIVQNVHINKEQILKLINF